MDAERARNAGKARRVLRARAECPERAAARPITPSQSSTTDTITTTTTHGPLSASSVFIRTPAQALCPEAEARAYLCVRVRVNVSEGNSLVLFMVSLRTLTPCTCVRGLVREGLDPYSDAFLKDIG